MKLKLVTAVAALVACSGAWADASAVELLCTFQDGTDSIRSYPLVSHEDHVTTQHGICEKRADVSPDHIGMVTSCRTVNSNCANSTADSSYIYDSVHFVDINRKTGTIEIKIDTSTTHCDPIGIPRKDESKLRVGKCVKASEVENKF